MGANLKCFGPKWHSLRSFAISGPKKVSVFIKEDIKEQPTSRNLSATATRVLQCPCPVEASQKYFSAIHTSPHLSSTHLTLAFVNNIILHLLLVLCIAVNVGNKN
jgi:hypothetical protein